MKIKGGRKRAGTRLELRRKAYDDSPGGGRHPVNGQAVHRPGSSKK